MGDEGVSVLVLSGWILLSLLFLFLLFWFGWRLSQRQQAVCPYSGIPLRRASEISYYSKEKVLRYLFDIKQYDNRIFKLSRASFSRETGRIFQDSINLFDTIKVDWTFLQKRYPGNWTSWGSLTKEQQEDIRSRHPSLSKFQTIESSPTPAPRLIEPLYVHTKPGPLYVDFETKNLLGWQVIPGTEFEVLILQKPSQQYFQQQPIVI